MHNLLRPLLKPLLATAALISAWATSANAEQFDTSFNGTGRYVENNEASLTGIAIFETPDGGVLQISSRYGPCSVGEPTQCPLFTYLTATGGYVVAYLASDSGLDPIKGAALDSHGRIVLVGPSRPLGSYKTFRVVRYLPNGALDTSFAGNGSVEIGFNGFENSANAVAIDADDNIIVVGGVTVSATDTDIGVAKLRGSDGSLDTSFNGSGKQVINFDLGATNRFETADAVAISPNGSRITLIGRTFDNVIGRWRVAIVRLNRGGSLDSTLCAGSCTFQGSYTGINSGRRVYYFGANTAHSDFVHGLALLGNGDFFITGATYSDDGSSQRAAIARFSANGDYAAEALNDGVGNNAYYSSVQVSDANGQRVLVAGDSGPNENTLLLQAYSGDLTPLAGYGVCLNTTAFCFTGGPGPTDFGRDHAESLNLDHLGRPLFASDFVANSGDQHQALFARFTNATGQKPDRIFRNGFQ